MTVGSDTLSFTYDASGRPLSITLNGTTYYYVTNLQGDVTAILSASGTAVVNYTYDAWGNPLATSGDLATTLGTLNPLRYRGYVYDTETELYYLQSRYYDPEVGRFLNADAFTSTGQGLLGSNMFAYCLCNPICLSDDTGTSVVAPVPTVIDYYGMHKQVQYDIAEDYGWAIEVYVMGPKGRGYLDLYDGTAQQYYEVKHIGAAAGPLLDDQMKKYDAAYVTGWRFFEYTDGFEKGVSRGNKVFSGYTEYKYWDISYRSNGDGLVVYTWKVNQERYLLHLAAITATVTTAAYCIAFGGAAQGALRKNLVQ